MKLNKKTRKDYQKFINGKFNPNDLTPDEAKVMLDAAEQEISFLLAKADKAMAEAQSKRNDLEVCLTEIKRIRDLLKEGDETGHIGRINHKNRR